MRMRPGLAVVLAFAIFTAVLISNRNRRSVSAPQTQHRTEASQQSSSLRDTSSGGEFYVLALSWAPNFCDDPQKSHASSECGHQLGFIVHGLWPTNADGSQPDECTGGRPIGQDNINALLPYIPDRGLIAHEWRTHWSCRATGQQFADAVKQAAATVKIPDTYRQPTVQQEIGRIQLEKDFAQANGTSPDQYRVSCHAGKLINFEACLTTDFRPRSCTGVRECPENQITLDAPQ